MEYNPMEELGLREEKQVITSAYGILSANEYVRDLCRKYIRNGTKLFDVIRRYEKISSFLLARGTDHISSVMQLSIPFLKAGGITDYDAMMFAKEDLIPMPGAKESLSYLRGLLPTYISSSSFEHDVVALCEHMDFPETNTSCTKVDFDSFEMSREEGRRFREMANEITKLKIPDTRYSLEGGERLSDEDAEILITLDRLFGEELPKMKVYEPLKEIRPIGTNEKSYSMLEIRRKTAIDFDSTAYIGTDIYDHLALDIVKESEGLALSFNGDEYALRASNVAVIGDDTTVIALLTAEFYDFGIEAVYDLIEDWNSGDLKNRICSDNNLRDALLKRYPKKLPIVRKVNRSDLAELVAESEAYKRKMKDRFRHVH